MEFKVLTITNQTGNINKSFTLVDNEIKKTSNAQVYNAIFTEKSFTSLEEFDTHIEGLKPNQALSLGKSKHNLMTGYILTKGQENIQHGIISRSNEYMSVQDNYQLCLGDVDPDDQMPDDMKNLDTQDKVYEAICTLHGDEYSDMSMRIGYGSSNGIKKEDTDETVYSSNSMHAYWLLKNVTDKNIEKYIEYLKRRAIITNQWYLKIHKDGSTSFRILLDLSVIKSLQSRFVFEAPPTIGEGLKKETPSSKFYNTKNVTKIIDLNKISYYNLPDWRVVYNQSKKANKHEIKRIKGIYKMDTIQELISTGLMNSQEAHQLIDTYLNTQTIPASMIIKGADKGLHRVYNFLQQDVPKWDIYDIFEPNKGLAKTFFNVKNIFDASIFTFLRGSATYSISFTLDDIFIVLNTLNYSNENINKVINALAKYLVDNNFEESDVSKIIEFFKTKDTTDELAKKFAKKYYSKYINKRVFEEMKNYAFMMMDGKNGFLRLDMDDDLNLFSKAGLKDKMENRNFYTKNPDDISKTIKIKIVEHWLKDSKRKDYDGITFSDYDSAPSNMYNLFKGFAYEPINHDDVDIQEFLDFIHEVICAKNELFYNVTLSFIAQIIQDPFNKLGTALILYGKKRIGKGTLIKTIGKLLGGDHYYQTDEAENVFGKFNIHLLRSILVYLNEAYWTGNKSHESKIKSLISDDDRTYQIKGGATFGEKNFTRLIIDSNSDYIVPATEDEGRYICLHVSPHKKDDKPYLKKINEFRDNQKKMEKLMFFFMNFKYKPYEKHLRQAPVSDLFIEQVKHNFSKIQEWWYRNLNEGNIYNVSTTKDADGIKVANEELWNSFKEFHKDKKHYDKQASFYSDFSKMLETCIIKATKVDDKNGKLIADLTTCREYFTTKYYVSNFEEMEDWEEYINPLMPKVVKNVPYVADTLT